MKGDRVPDQDHVARYCPPSRFTEDGRITGAAFQLRPGEKELSVNWLEFLSPAGRDVQIREIRKVLALKMSRVSTAAKIALLNVGQMCDHVCANSSDGRSLEVLHIPEQDDPSHSGIFNYREDDILIADLIAEIVQETHPAR